MNIPSKEAIFDWAYFTGSNVSDIKCLLQCFYFIQKKKTSVMTFDLIVSVDENFSLNEP